MSRRDSPSPPPGQSQKTALSFDDGPHEKFTPRLLDIAKEHQARFSFFVVGERAKEHKPLLVRMRDEGHEIGNHSWSHPQMKACTEEEALSQVRRCHELILEAVGTVPTLFRPPYGEINSRLRKAIEDAYGYKTVLWNIDTQDWRSRDSHSIHENICGQHLHNSIVLLHDIYESSIDAISMLLEGQRERGVEWLTVSALRKSLKFA